MELCVWIPDGDGPFPILLVAPRFYQIGWAREAVRRGYLVCLYPGVDSHHQEKDYPGWERTWEVFRAEYPEATWTEISTKAWLASRCLDCLLELLLGRLSFEGLYTLPFVANVGPEEVVRALSHAHRTVSLSISSASSKLALIAFSRPTVSVSSSPEDSPTS